MIGLLQTGSGYNADSLAAACKVSRRTIFRDLEILRRSGVPLVLSDSDQHYRIPSTYFLPPTSFTTEEALAMLLLSRQLGCDGGVPFQNAAMRAAAKLEGSLPLALQEELRVASRSLSIELSAVNRLRGQTDVYQRLVAAVARRRSVNVVYDSFTEGQLQATKLDPYHLLFSRRSWYVIGRSAMHREVRTFNLGRIRELTQRDDTFDVPRSFNLSSYLRNAWSLIPEPGEDQQVWVRFQPLVARNVAEVGWHATQRCEWLPDGRLDFRVTVSGLNEISWWILGYGDQAEVLAPLELRQLLARRVENMARMYAAAPAADGEASLPAIGDRR